jgi:hypothetical protein
MRPGHVLAGATSAAGVGMLLGWPTGHVLLAAAVGAVVGPLPDVDQHRWWRRLDRVLPDEWLGHAGPMRHRGITHWWGLPALASGAMYAWASANPSVRTWLWLALAALVGWCSHLAADWVFGRACVQEGRGPGIPLAPWWHHRGLGGDVGGLAERMVAVPALTLLLGWQGWVIVHG